MATPQPKNHAPFSTADVLAATGGRIASGAVSGHTASVGVAIDSRVVEPGNLFVAIAGERFDGHDHVEAAVAAGARVVLVSRDVGDVAGAVVVRVGDTTLGLGALARFHRRRWAYGSLDRARREVVAITGSAGKTTTRHATASLLAALGRRVHASAGNLNNAIGIPLTLLGLTSDHDLAVVEVGTNARGEIAHGASLTEPDVAILTLVAEAHTQGIGSIADVAEEKGALFFGLRRWGTAIANGDDPHARAQLPRSPARRYVTYGVGPDVHVRLVSRTPLGTGGSRIEIEHAGARIEARIPLLGSAGAHAVLAAIAAALTLVVDVSPDALARAIASIGPSEPGRLCPIELGDTTIVIDDAYNANPASMIASIDAAREIAADLGRRLVLVLGEMFELGPESALLHARVGTHARAAGGLLIAVSGEARAFVGEPSDRGLFAADLAAVKAAVRRLVRPGDVVLVKASHSVGLGAIVADLEQRSRPAPIASEPTPRFASPATFREALVGSKVVVVGLGKSGVSAAKLARRLGADVTATDVASEDKLSDSARSMTSEGIRLRVGGHAEAGLEEADLVVVSPGVPGFDELARAERRSVPVIGELELATRLLPTLPSVAITGSNGKSTTTLLVGALLAGAGKHPFVGGNLGDPPSDIVPVPARPASNGWVAEPARELAHDVLVLEVSSYQAERMPWFHPRAAALLNVSPNHLDRYDGFDSYVRAKGNLFVNQTSADVAVIPVGDPLVAREAARGRATVLRFGPLDSPGGVAFGYSPTEIVDCLRQIAFPRSAIRLAGDHNALNVCAALALISPFGLERDVVLRVLEEFAGLPHRIAFVMELDGVRYYDDSKGTNVGATVAAIRGLSEAKIVLIAGGRDKLGSYDPLVSALEERGRGAVLIGEAAPRIADAIGSTSLVVHAASMDEAVERARALARPGDAVLLSPACSSFDMFRDYKHRGDAFVAAVRGLPAQPKRQG